MEMEGWWSILRYVLEVELSGLTNGLDGVYDGKRYMRSDSWICIFDLGNWIVPLAEMG